MRQIAASLIVIGFIIVLVGILYQIGAKLNLPIGNLPGDIKIEKEGSMVYIPITTMIVISILISILLWIYRTMMS